MIKKDLIKFLQEKQTSGGWVTLSKEYGADPDQIRRLWNKVKKSSSKKGIHIVLGCVHVPYENKELLQKVLKLIQDQKENIIGFHLIGDFLDLKSLSFYDDKTMSSSPMTLGKEYQAGNKVLDLIDSVLPENIEKTFLYGNHEHRYIRYTKDIKNYKTADAIQSPEQALQLESRGYKVLTNWEEDYFNIGKYQVFHGIYCTISPVKSHLDKLRESCIFAHTHRIDQHYDGILHGVNIGTMADIQSSTFSYMSRVAKTTWKNGFGIVNVNGTKSHAEVIVCENNSFFYGGKYY